MTSVPGTPRERYSTLLDRVTQSEQWDRSLSVARDWLAEEPAAQQAHLAAGLALINLAQPAPALSHVQQALAAMPDHSFAHRLASIACERLGRRADAERHIAEAIRLSPQDAANWYFLALMRYHQGAYEAAAKHVRHSLELAPQNAEAVNLLALCERTDPWQRYDGYRRALALDPENAIVHNNLGLHYLYTERNLGRAADSFRRALSIDPTNKDTQDNLLAALREHDPVYRTLRWPLALFGGGMPGGRGGKRQLHPVAFVGGFMGAFVLILGACLVFFFPLLQGYEWLTLVDLQRQHGIPGARRGGWLGFWNWPKWVRTTLLIAAYVLAWVGAVWGLSLTSWGVALFGFVVVLVLVLMLLFFLNRIRIGLRDAYRRFLAKRSEKLFQRRLAAMPPPNP